MGALLMLHDIAAQEELEREIEISRRLASIGRLTAGVGHEVKNPINAMVVHLELLRGKLANSTNTDGAQRHVEVLASEMSRLDRVVQTLADFSRPIEPQLREQDIVPIIRSVVLNAMQAMPNGGDLQLHLASDRQSACVSVRDTGAGIAPDKLPRIFDLYYTTKATGSGIGLAMTYRIVQLHGGIIEVTSESNASAVNHGTTFTLRMPLAGRPSVMLPQAVSV